MVKRSWKLIWPSGARDDLKEAYDNIYHRSKSKAIAERVRDDLLKSTKALIENPYIYEKDRFRVNNETGNFRAFEKHSFRISYMIDDDNITIIRVRHAHMEPLIS